MASRDLLGKSPKGLAAVFQLFMLLFTYISESMIRDRGTFSSEHLNTYQDYKYILFLELLIRCLRQSGPLIGRPTSLLGGSLPPLYIRALIMLHVEVVVYTEPECTPSQLLCS